MVISQILALKGGREAGSSELINLNKETEASCSNRSENSSEINLDISRPPQAPPPAADESPTMNSYRGLPFYASAARADIDQLLHSDHHPSPAAAAPKMELGHGAADDTAPATAAGSGGTFGSLLCGAAVDEQPPFWPWADGHHTFQ